MRLQMADPTLSIVFPAYGEEGRIAEALRRTAQYLDRRGLDAEVVVVNDGSLDRTAEIAEEFAARDPRFRVVSHSPNRGKGFAVQRGLLEARGRYRLFLDVDMATPVELAGELVQALEAGADMVIGSRHLPASRIEVPQPFVRRFMGSVFRRLAIGALRLGVTDVTCGFKGLTAAAAAELCSVQCEHGWAFDAELIYVARKWGLDVREIPVTWQDSGQTTVRPLKAACRSLQELIQIRGHDREGKYVRPATPPAPG
jgi:dolichyl-phosphate beta-glucosyltransferase